MISVLGQVVVAAALITALVGAAGAFAGARSGWGAGWGRRAAALVLVLILAAVALMEYALLTHDFSVKYVADVGGLNVPTYFTFISLWAALEGSILFWALLLSGYTVLFLVLYRNRFAELQPYIAGILLLLSSFFLFVITVPGNPFTRVDPLVACRNACTGPNPLLQNHWMMGVHPVLLYLGYVGLSIPFAIVVASLVAGTPGAQVMRLIRRWALVPWVFLSLGIIGGMWWSYAVLGWGGYWSWDPVENASVMPWLVTTAFLHSVQVQERRQMLKTWTLSLVIAAFLLSILGTFLTRSGVLASVHSFTQSSVGPVFLVFFGVLLVGSIALLLARSRALAAPGSLESSICRETAFLVNNLLLVAITFTILLGTLFPLFAEAVQGSQLSVGGPYFNHIAVPIGLALLFLMGVGPVLPWGAGRLDDLQYKFVGPVGAAVGVVLILLAIGVRGIGTLVTFGLASFALAVTFARVAADTRTRRGNTKEGWGSSTRNLLRANPRRYGGFLAHTGVLLAIIGIAASQTYQARAQATLLPGQSIRVDGYTVTYHGLRPVMEGDKISFQGSVSAVRGGQNLGTFRPSLNDYLSYQQLVVTPAVREEPFDMLRGLFQGKNPFTDLGQLVHGRNPFEDLYLVPESMDLKNANQHRANRWMTLQVLVNPMVGFVWLGGILMGLGGIYALIPARRRRRVEAASPERVRVRPEEVTV